MNWTLITIRGWIPALAVLALGAVVAYVTAILRRVAPIPLEPSHVLLTAVSISAIFAGLFYWRLLQWEAGQTRACERCGGPLGGLLNGKRYYGRQLNDYRRCYNCGKASADV